MKIQPPAPRKKPGTRLDIFLGRDKRLLLELFKFIIDSPKTSEELLGKLRLPTNQDSSISIENLVY